MDIPGIREALHKQPFEPFDIRLADGRLLPVQHPDFVAVGPLRIIVIVTGLPLYAAVKSRQNGRCEDGHCTGQMPVGRARREPGGIGRWKRGASRQRHNVITLCHACPLSEDPRQLKLFQNPWFSSVSAFRTVGGHPVAHTSA
jgi:hypothetical protein